MSRPPATACPCTQVAAQCKVVRTATNPLQQLTAHSPPRHLNSSAHVAGNPNNSSHSTACSGRASAPQRLAPAHVPTSTASFFSGCFSRKCSSWPPFMDRVMAAFSPVLSSPAVRGGSRGRRAAAGGGAGRRERARGCARRSFQHPLQFQECNRYASCLTAAVGRARCLPTRCPCLPAQPACLPCPLPLRPCAAPPALQTSQVAAPDNAFTAVTALH